MEKWDLSDTYTYQYILCIYVYIKPTIYYSYLKLSEHAGPSHHCVKALLAFNKQNKLTIQKKTATLLSDMVIFPQTAVFAT